jgi:hypothetical protein
LTQTDEIGEAVEIGEIVEIANVHADFAHLAENTAGCRKRLGEYPTLSATKPPPEESMILQMVEQVRRGFLIIVNDWRSN